MTLNILRGDQESEHFRAWKEWFHAIDYLNQKFIRRTEICPFTDTEMLFSGFLACAATLVDGIGFNEMAIRKSSRENNASRNGRSDLYIDFPDATYSFELKRLKKMANVQNLQSRLEAAIGDIGDVPDDEHDFAAAIAYGHAFIDGKDAIFRHFSATDMVDFGLEFGHSQGPNSYLYLKLKS